ncbi:hypothetical protein BL254_02865 [Protofrankia sp. BMG5.30]|uniref:Uncharacterized protein n=1 Tax=Protofrankia coriariae TaxID=1562887 RepID=A0ABR5F695_9ACTN|nr:hypothetical protein FrCorBMG51_05905 [Protofrankia coriariae]ONH37825.1 hypothetical protein BL254_02865 [Protofrankia sp. BMG5.30]
MSGIPPHRQRDQPAVRPVAWSAASGGLATDQPTDPPITLASRASLAEPDRPGRSPGQTA